MNRTEFVARWGYWKAFNALIARKLYQYFGIKLLVIKFGPLPEEGTTCETDSDLVFRVATRDELLKATTNPLLNMSKRFVEDALERGHKCIAAFDGNDLVGYSWRSVSETLLNHSVKVQFPEELVYHYKSFVLPDYRGKRILEGVKRVHFDSSTYQGRSSGFNCVEYSNYASLKASSKQGEVTVGYIILRASGGKSWCWHSSGPKKAGIRFCPVITL